MTNTLAALLKVDVTTEVRLDERIARDRIGESKHLAFARDLVALSGGLLADFDATLAK